MAGTIKIGEVKIVIHVLTILYCQDKLEEPARIKIPLSLEEIINKHAFMTLCLHSVSICLVMA